MSLCTQWGCSGQSYQNILSPHSSSHFTFTLLNYSRRLTLVQVSVDWTLAIFYMTVTSWKLLKFCTDPGRGTSPGFLELGRHFSPERVHPVRGRG